MSLIQHCACELLYPEGWEMSPSVRDCPLAFQSGTVASTLVLVFPPSHFLLELCLSTVFLSTNDHNQQQQQNSGIYMTTVSGFRL